jgi:hypothetical protein
MALPIINQPRLLLVRPQYTPDPDTGNHPQNILWFQSTTAGTPTLANLTAMAAAFDPAWYLVWSDVGAQGTYYLGSIWTDFSSAFGLTYSSVGTYSPHVGSVTGRLPPNSACLISLKSGERFRGGHFRIYLPWIGQAALSATDSSMLLAANTNVVTTNFSNLDVATSGSGVLGGQLQVLYRHRTDPVKARLDPIVSFTVQQLLATQRRRLRKAPHK